MKVIINVLLALLCTVGVINCQQQVNCIFPRQSVFAGTITSYCAPNVIVSGPVYIDVTIQSIHTTPSVSLVMQTASGATFYQNYFSVGYQNTSFATSATDPVAYLNVTNNNAYAVYISGTANYTIAPTTTAAPTTTTTTSLAPTTTTTTTTQAPSSSSSITATPTPTANTTATPTPTPHKASGSSLIGNLFLFLVIVVICF